MKPFNIYMGWDAREVAAYKVCEFSLRRRSSVSIDVIPLKHKELRKRGLFKRPWIVESDTGQWKDLIDNKPFSTEFSHSRFLVPAMQNYEGWALFMDCDMLWDCDIKELLWRRNKQYAVMVVKHNHKPKDKNKMDDQVQDLYFRKNWSSFVLWNCAHPANKHLTAEKVSYMQGCDLHSFSWLDESLIGAIDIDFNWIEGVSPVLKENKIPKVIHYTNGGPWFENCQDVMYADLWTKEFEEWNRNGNDGVPTGVPTTKFDYQL